MALQVLGCCSVRLLEVQSVQASLLQWFDGDRREGAWTDMLITGTADSLRYERKTSRSERAEGEDLSFGECCAGVLNDWRWHVAAAAEELSS